tara:strand:- start:1373 stop:1687 length:315 start_codon:yes stop_codon:yes gene_type:complete
VHRPIGAARFAEFSGSVQRINNPNSFLLQAGQIIAAFFGQDSIVRKLLLKSFHDETVSLKVTSVFHSPTVSSLAEKSFTYVQKKFPGIGRDASADRVILEIGHK